MLDRLTTPGLAIHTYLIIDPIANTGAVIDPPRQIDPILRKIQATNTQIIAILETHVHADFVSGAKELKDRLSNHPPIFCSGLGGPKWIPSYADVIATDRLEIPLGSLRLQAWHTPGHTPEHLMWVVYDDTKSKTTPIQALTGDFLFVGSVGRPDLLGDNSLQELSTQLYHSVFHILSQLPDSVEIHPAHGAGSLCGKGISGQTSSTLAQERQHNPFLQHMPKDQWIQYLLTGMPPAPSYFARMKQLNVVGPPLLKELKPIERIPISHIHSKEAFLVDLRSKEEFAERHIAGSTHIPFSPTFISWAPVIIPYDQDIILIANDKQIIQQAVEVMRLVGLDRASFFAIADQNIQEALLATFPLIPPRELMSRMQKNPNLLVIDVRTANEWRAGHIEGAKHIPLSDLSNSLDQLPKNKPIALVCGSGSRSSIGASILQREGYQEVCNIQGGMQEWVRAQLPIVKSS